MSLLFSSVDVLNGPTVGIKEQQVNLPVFSHGDNKQTNLDVEQERKTEDFVLLGRRANLNSFSYVTKEEDDENPEAEGSSQSSSIGVESSSSLEEENEEVGNEAQSKLKEPVLSSLDSLEDPLPIKRGLSNFFAGKSKSFVSLSDAANRSARDLVKQENPYNKRRRILMANKNSWGRRTSYSSLITSLPSLLSPDLVKEGEQDEERVEGDSSSPLPKYLSHGGGRALGKSFMSPRSFSLSDLQNV